MYLCPEDETTDGSSPVKSSSTDEGRGESLSQSNNPSNHHRAAGSKSYAENVDPQSSPMGSMSSPVAGFNVSPMNSRRKSSRARKPSSVVREAGASSAAALATVGGVKRKIKMDLESEEEDEQLKYAFISEDDDLGPMGGSGKSSILMMTEEAVMACPSIGGIGAAGSSNGNHSFRPGSSTGHEFRPPSSVADDHSYTANSSHFDPSSSPGGINIVNPGTNSVSSAATLPFLHLEPPLSEEDYNFALEASEGIADLFDEDILI